MTKGVNTDSAQLPPSPSHPLRRGALLAVLGAVAFGVTTPLIQRWGREGGALTTASLLYAGAALASVRRRGPNPEAPVGVRQLPRLMVIAFAGALVAPASFAWGLQRTSAVSASLLLNLEAVFTLLLARVVYGEPIGRRVAIAASLMVIGGAVLVSGDFGRAGLVGIGTIAVVVATLAWSADNVLTRPLAERDPVQVVRWKAGLGAASGALLAIATHDSFPPMGHAVALLACGATGYGISLRLYLLAQRQIGAGRTGSIFAVAPLVGALTAWVMGDRSIEASSLAGGVLFAVGVYLHLTENHGHFHTHQLLEHEHAHRHDDGHHDHHHTEPVEGEHSHFHAHDDRSHEHPHAPDAHHLHRHEHD